MADFGVSTADPTLALFYRKELERALPCPRCGGTDLVIHHIGVNYVIACPTDWEYNPEDPDCLCGIGGCVSDAVNDLNFTIRNFSW